MHDVIGSYSQKLQDVPEPGLISIAFVYHLIDDRRIPFVAALWQSCGPPELSGSLSEWESYAFWQL